MKKFKLVVARIVPCLIIALCVIGVANCKGCKKAEAYKYPSVTPVITDANKTYVKIGDYNITNNQIYHRLLQSYGVSALSSLVDEVLYQDYQVNEEDYLEYLDKYIYNTDDPSTLSETEKAELLEAFKVKMLSLGLNTETDWKDYYRLEYKKIQAAVEKYKAYIDEYNKNEDNADPFFKDSDYETYYNSNYHGTVSVVLVTFDSIVEAKAVMKDCNIDTANLFGNWKTLAGTEMTYEEVLNAFKNMYEEVNGSVLTEPVTYTYDDLYKMSSTIAVKAFGLEAYDSEKAESLTTAYTHGPLLFGSRYYLLLKTASTEPEKTLEEVKDEITEVLVDNKISTSYIAAKANEARYDADLKIYDEGLEILYKASYDSVYTSLEQTDYNAYKSTTEESNVNIATFTYKDKTYTITADQLFKYLSDSYGTVLTSLLMQQYVVLNNRSYNNVYDYLKDQVLDEEAYNAFVKAEITEYKDAFNAGEYASSGYPTSYGWDNFLKDFLGVFSENELLVNLDSGLYTESLAKLGKTLYMSEPVYDETDPTKVVTPSDIAVQNEMKRIYEDFYGGTIIGLNAYYDKDLNNIADEVDPSSSDALLAVEFIDALYNFAKGLDFDTVTLKLKNAVNIYNMATSKDSTWGTYKKAGLRVVALASATYTNTTTADEDFLAVVKQLWNKVNTYAEENSLQSTVMGVSLDPGVRTIINSTVSYVTAEKFADTVNSFFTKKGAYRLVLTNATKRTEITKTEDVYNFPTLEEYENYLLPDDDENKTTVGSTLKTKITTYYTVAIANLASETAINNLLMNECIKLIPEVTFTSNNDTAKKVLEEIINGSIIK